MKRAVDRTFDPESDTQFVAQVSALGAIADAVVRDVVKARSGRKRLSECAAVERAADLISRVATGSVDSVDDWSHVRPDTTMRWLTRLKEPGTGRTLRREGEHPPVSISDVNDALRAARADEATPDQLTSITQYFEFLGDSTLHAARDTVYGRASRHSWPTS